MSSAVIVGVLCSVFNGWLLNKQRKELNSNSTELQAQSQPVIAQPLAPVAPAAKTTSTHRIISGFDNPNWVYGDNNNQQIHLHPEPTMAMASAEGTEAKSSSSSSRQMAISIIATPERSAMRYATIRRAPSIMTSLPMTKQITFTTSGRNQIKSASFRLDPKGGQRGQRTHPALSIQRSKTMRETTFTVAAAPSPPPPSAHTFGQRFQSDLEGMSALSFVHDSVEEEDETQINDLAPPQLAAAKAKQPTAAPPPPPPLPPPPPPPPLEVEAVQRRNLRKSDDRIVLRVESFIRNKPIPVPGTLDRLAAAGKAPRVSSSTQTELSVLRGSTVSRSNTGKRSTIGSAIKVSVKTPPMTNLPQNSPVESSSGYSSPRSTESKSPTPEPSSDVMTMNLKPGRDYNNTGGIGDVHANVTVIQIDPSSNNCNPVTRISKGSIRKEEAMYATPMKRSERNAVTTCPLATQTETPGAGAFRVSIQSKPAATIHRSVSFHQLSQSGRRAVYSNEWLNGPPPSQHNQGMSIPRPALRVAHIQQHHQQQQLQGYTTLPSGAALRRTTSQRQLHPQQLVAGNSNNLSRSSSMYLAMSEIQRKLDLLQVLTAARHHLTPVHGDDYSTLSNADQQRRKNGNSRNNRSSTATSSTLKTSLSAADLLDDSLDSAKTLAYLSELEMLARHWRTQLSHKVNPPLRSSSSTSSLAPQNINKKEVHHHQHHVASIDYRQVELKSSSSKKMSVGLIEDDAFQC